VSDASSSPPPPPAAVPPDAGHERIAGYDVARAFAIGGMVLINFGVYLLGPPRPGASAGAASLEIVLRWLAHVPGGRASSLFVTLAGVGIARMSAGDPDRGRRTLLMRAAFLLVLGIANLAAGWWIDILHFYAVYLALAALFFLRASRPALVGSALAFALLGSALEVALPSELRGDDPELSVRGVLRDALIDGVHPVVPWLAFLLWGMWLGGLDLRDRLLRRAVLVRALGAFVALELASLALRTWAVGAPSGAALLPVLGTDWSPSTLYVLSAASTATAMICLGHALVARWAEHALVKALASTGQLALTIYLIHAHLAIGIPRFALGLGHAMPVETMLAYWVLFVVLIVPFAVLVRRRFARGPVEWVMRTLTGSPEHALGSLAPTITPREVPRAAFMAIGAAILALPLADFVGTTPPRWGCAPDAPIALGASRAAQLTLSCPHASSTLVLEAATPVVITTRSGIDAYLEVHRASASGEDKLVGEDDDSGPSLDARWEGTLEPGTYELRVRPYSASTGPFVVTVEPG
jgi:uncharacterized membrane protein YeiB